MFFVCLLACLLRIGSELFYHLYHELQLPQEVKACASKWKRVKEGSFHPTVHTQGDTISPPMLPAGSTKSLFLFPGPLHRNTAALPPMALPPSHVEHQGPAGALTGMTWSCCSISRAAPPHIHTQPSARFTCWALLSSQKFGKIHCKLTLCLGQNDPQLPRPGLVTMNHPSFPEQGSVWALQTPSATFCLWFSVYGISYQLAMKGKKNQYASCKNNPPAHYISSSLS